MRPTRARWSGLFACAFLMLQIRFEQQALADQQLQQQNQHQPPTLGPPHTWVAASELMGRLAEPSNQHQLSQHQAQQLRHLRRLSCYVCTTMDYENPNDNACKDMIKYRPKMASYYSAPMMSFHQTTMQPPTAHPAAAETEGVNTVPSMESLVSSSYPSSQGGNYYESTTPVTSMSQQDFEVAQLQAANKQQQNNSISNYNSTMMPPNPNLEFQQQQAMTPVQVSGGYYPQYRVPHPKEFTRVRTCSEEENFCSIVSVVNLEFHNDKLIPKFWAMERNCSKSCNNGCMIIGERVRLRVCSSCCLQPNCNYGSGASKALNISYTQHTYQFAAMLLVSLITATLSIHKSHHIASDY